MNKNCFTKNIKILDYIYNYNNNFQKSFIYTKKY